MVLAQENDELHKKTEQQTKQKNAIAELVVFSGTAPPTSHYPSRPAIVHLPALRKFAPSSSSLLLSSLELSG